MSDNDYALQAVHRKMLDDEIRCELFRKALFQLVPTDGVVLDVGAGTGILSIFAAQAGAGKVYAVEATGIAQFARELIELNGFSDRIEVMQAPIEEVSLPEKVDLIVSEWLGGFAIDENMLRPVLLARDQWLKPDGLMLPQSVEIWLAPCWVSWLDEERERWLSDRYNVDLSILAEGLSSELFYEQHDLTMENLLAEPQVIWTTDVLGERVEQAEKAQVASPTFQANRDGRINGLAAWFVADLAENIELSTAPSAPDTHWGQTFLPLDVALQMQQGANITVEMSCTPTKTLETWSEWTVQIREASPRRSSGILGRILGRSSENHS